MEYILEICQTSAVIYFVITYILKKYNKMFLVVYPVVAMICCFFIVTSVQSSFVARFVHILLYLVLPYIMTKCSLKCVIYIFFVVVGFVSINICLINIMLAYLNVNQNVLMIVAIVTSLVTISFFAMYAINKKIQVLIKRLINITSAVKVVFFIIIWSLFLLLSVNYISMTRYFNKRINITISILMGFLLIGSVIAFAYLIFNYIKKEHYKKLSNVLEDNIIKQAKHYEKTIKMYNDLRTFKHDYSNLKIGLNNLLETGQIDEAIKYLNSSDEKFKTNYQFINTGNTVVDAIFSSKQSEIIQNNIKIEFNGIIPYDALEIADLCVVLGNSLDNAVEACAKISENIEKIIEIEVKKNRELLLIQMKNPIHDKVNINNNTVKTTKENAEVHGIGFYSINNIVKKYDGFYEITSDDTHFTLKMGFMIKNK